MPQTSAPTPPVLSISRQIVRIFALLLIFTNVLLGLLLYFQFERQLTVAWTDRYHVPLDNLAKEIEYGLQLGFSLGKMENLPQLLAKTTRRYPELTALFIVDRHGSLLVNTPGHADRFPSLTSLLEGVGNREINGLPLTSTQGHHVLAWSIENPFGDTEGFVLMELPWTALQQLREEGRGRLILGISGTIIGFIILSLGLFQLICRDLELSLGEMDQCADRLLAGKDCVFQRSSSRQMASAFADLVRRLGRVAQHSTTPPARESPAGGLFSSSNFRARILTGALLLLLGSCAASTTVGYLIFRDIYLPVLYSQSRIIGQSLGELVSEMHAHGIPVERMAGTERIFADLMVGFPQIAAIGLYDAQGRRLHALSREGTALPPASIEAQGLDAPLSVTIPIPYRQTLIGMIRLDKVPHFFAKRLLDIALDVIALLVVSILIASELLTFMVRFLVVVPIEGLLRELRGDPSLAHSVPAILASSLIHQIGRKIRALLEQAPALPAAPAMPTGQIGSSPLMPYVRPPLFLVVFADALSLSFFPLYVESLSRPIGWLPAGLITGLPISVFMLVWAISLPMSGQWSDRVGRRRSLLFGTLVTAIGLALTALAQDFIQLILVRSLTAVGYGMVYITAQSYVADHTTARDRTRGMATFLGGFFSGSLCGAALGGILADRIGYQMTFGLSALMSLMAAVFVYQFIGQGPVAVSPTAPAPTAAPPRLRLGDFMQLFRDRCFLPITLLTAIPAKILLTGFLYYSAPLYLRDAGASQSSTGRVIMLHGLSIVLLGPIAAWMADRWHLRRSFIGIGALLSAAALSIPFLHPGGGGLLAAILMIGIAHAIAVAPQLAVITEHMQTRPDPPSMGKVIGIFRLSERAGNILGPMLFGALLTMASPEATFLHVGVYVALSSLLFLALLGHCHHRGPV